MQHKTFIMGILNVTPDSFSDGGMFVHPKAILEKIQEMIAEGADIIDVGGESTRPGAEKVSEQEELQRVIPVIKELHKKNPTVPISVDTYKSQVAEESLQHGATIINSLGGFTFDSTLADVVSKYQCKIIMYHIKGEPQSMQSGEIIYKDVIEDITKFFEEQIALGLAKGIKREQFILDPGIGFGKTVEQNIEIIQRLGEFKKLDLPLLIGVSRKSHLGKLLQTELGLQEIPDTHERLEASLAETAVAVLNGASIVRTHDVKETKRFVVVLDRVKPTPTLPYQGGSIL